MEWTVKIKQELKYTEEITGTFTDIVDAMQFVNLALSYCKNVSVTISYEASNHEHEKEESDE